jgi:hypothetical protein
MATIPLETYKSWVQRLNELDARFRSLFPWTNLYPKSSAQCKWWRKLCNWPSLQPFLAVKNSLDNLATKQYPVRAVSEIFDEKLSRDYSDDFTKHWKARVDEVHANHKGRRYPKPELLASDKEQLTNELLSKMRSLVQDIRHSVNSIDVFEKLDELEKRIKCSESLLPPTPTKRVAEDELNRHNKSVKR